MVEDQQGFLYPYIEKQTCISCGLCEKCCPVCCGTLKAQEQNPVAYAAYSMGDSVREKSSSGGLFSVLAKEIIGLGGVVFGAVFTSDAKTAHHIWTDTVDGLLPMCGSKYTQSEIGTAFSDAKAFLEQGRYVFFTGTPCQIVGLKTFLGKDHEKLLCADLACHGVPSPKVWRTYLREQEEKAGALVKYVRFRDKSSGWRNYSMQIRFSNDAIYRKPSSQDAYMRVFLSDCCLRPSCYNCRFKGLERVSDITMADFWGIERVLPDMDDDKGTSLVLIHSEKGQRILSQLSEQIKAVRTDLSSAVSGNQALLHSAVQSPNSKDFFKELGKLPFSDLAKKYAPTKRTVKGMVSAVLRKLGLLEWVRKRIKTP